MSQLLVQPDIKIKNINVKNQHSNEKKQNFTGVADGLTSAFQLLEANPMLKVSAIDVFSAIGPRTGVDLVTAGVPAASETLIRESSGLIVNCLIPSFFVLGASAAINNSMMKDFKGINMTRSWATEDTLKKMAELYKSASPENKAESYVRRNLEQLEVFEDANYKRVSGYLEQPKVKDAIKILTDTINNSNMSSKETNKAVKSAYQLLADELKATEVIRYIKDEKNGQEVVQQAVKKAFKIADGEGAFSSKLSDLLRDHVDLGRKFSKFANDADIDKFVAKSSKMVKTKSLLGLAAVIPLAMSVQTINRAITRRKYKVKGAPIYKDFAKGEGRKELTPQEKSKFFVQKCLSAATMVGVAVLSMMKVPTRSVLDKMIQFKGMFPSTDQCRIIATSTFASRMFAAEDPNELREATVRDIATFSFLYFLGDYAEKAVATLIEHTNKNVKLINRLVPDDKSKFFLRRFWNWVRNYKIKSFDEVPDKLAKNMRSVSQASGLAVSILALGLALPFYNRKVTEKKEKIRKEQEAKNNQTPKTQFLVTKGIDSLPDAFKNVLRIKKA